MEDQTESNKNAKYKTVIASLQELNLTDVALFLQRKYVDGNYKNEIKKRETPSTDNSDCSSFDSSDDDSMREDDFHTKLQEANEPLSINVKKATKFRDGPEYKHIEIYPMRSNPRGMVLIIANNLYKKQKDRRPSAKHDEANLKRLFEEMGFKVLTYFDLTGAEIEKRIKEFSQMPELRRVDSAFVIISSHGKGKLGHQETEILGIDYNSSGYKPVVCTTIMNYFTAANCQYLSGKPKIFIFQTCRGKNEQVAVPRYTTDAATSFSRPTIEEPYVQFSETMRNYEDMLIVYSTIPGYVSYRDELNGSWFIQVLCEVFMNYADKVHIRDLFDMIDSRLKNIRTLDDNCQTPSITSQGFNRRCYLNPGLFENKQLNGNGEIVNNKEIYKTFKCCPGRKANIYICSECESVYHYKCLKNLQNVKVISKSKADCCSKNETPSTADKENDNFFNENKSLRENIEELNKILDKLRGENNNLKGQISTFGAQHINIVSHGIHLKSSENLKLENLVKENELLKQLNTEMKDNNELLKEKNDWLSNKLKKKKSHWVRKNLSKVLKRKRKRTSNTIEPIEI